MRSRSHLGTGFRVWRAQRTWFWLVEDPCRDGAAVGAAANHARAVCDARLYIEELSARRAPAPTLRGAGESTLASQAFRSISIHRDDWEQALASLEHYLNVFRDAAA